MKPLLAQAILAQEERSLANFLLFLIFCLWRGRQMPRRWQRSPRALSFLGALLSPPGRQWEARPADRKWWQEKRNQSWQWPKSTNGQQPRPTVSPGEILAKARSRVSKLEAAIQVLDGEDPALAGLQEALLKAKNQAKVPSLEDQVASTELFITRAKKRVDDAEVRVVDAIATVTGCARNWRMERGRLARLQDDLSRSTMSGKKEQDESSRIPADVASELERFRCQVAEVTGENALQSLMHASRTEVGSELHQVQVELQELRQERDVSVSATSNLITAEEADQSRTVVAELRRERSALETQLAKRADGSGKDLSSVMGTLIDDADADLKSGSSRFNPY